MDITELVNWLWEAAAQRSQGVRRPQAAGPHSVPSLLQASLHRRR